MAAKPLVATIEEMEATLTLDGVFDRVVCGVDLSPAGRDAAREAARIVAPGGSLLLLSATEGDPVTVVAPAGLGYASARTRVTDETRDRCRTALLSARDEAREVFPGARIKRVEGGALSSLLEAVKEEQATLAVVGTHETERLPGILLGSVATHLLHMATCSVLVVRSDWPDGGPSRIIVGVDGSPASDAALAAARDLCSRLGGELEPVTDDAPVRTLVALARQDDLIVVGSRGLHGPRALLSVSERVAHQAPCSVLVVRRPLEEAPR